MNFFKKILEIIMNVQPLFKKVEEYDMGKKKKNKNKKDNLSAANDQLGENAGEGRAMNSSR